MLGCRALTNLEIENLSKHLSERDKIFFYLGLKTGFRVSELLSIKIAQLYELNGSLKNEILIARANMKGKKKGRSAQLSEDTKNILTSFISTLPKSQVYLFESGRGQLSRSQAWRAIKSAAILANLTGKIACHSTRKTFSRNVYELSGKDLVLTQKMLGHINIQSTISYLNVESEQMEAIWKAI